MAIQTRYAGDALPVVNVDAGLTSPATTTGAIISTGLTKAPIALGIAVTNIGAGEMVTGGAVETILRAIAQDSTITAYQVNTGYISVLLEATGIGPSGDTGASVQGAEVLSNAQIATAVQTRLTGLLGGASGAGTGPTGSTAGGNIGIAGNVWMAGATVTNVGLKLATS